VLFGHVNYAPTKLGFGVVYFSWQKYMADLP